MDNLLREITEEIENMRFYFKETQKKLGRRKPGTLAVKIVKGNKYYYESKMKNGKVRQRYLGTVSDDRVGEFIMYKVFEVRLEILRVDIESLKKVMKFLHDYSSDVILQRLGRKYQTAFWGGREVDEFEAHGALEVQSAQENEYYELETGFEKYDMERDVITCDGKRVRSMGECVIYDILTRYHIVFWYERPLTFYDEDGNPFTIHPDFVIECLDGSLIIIEHLGMLDMSDYANQQEHKMRLYHINGYDLGHNLIFTSANSTYGVDSSFINDLIKYVVLPRAKTTD